MKKLFTISTIFFALCAIYAKTYTLSIDHIDSKSEDDFYNKCDSDALRLMHKNPSWRKVSKLVSAEVESGKPIELKGKNFSLKLSLVPAKDDDMVNAFIDFTYKFPSGEVEIEGKRYQNYKEKSISSIYQFELGEFNLLLDETMRINQNIEDLPKLKYEIISIKIDEKESK